MNIKNHKTLIFSASFIIGTTIIALFTLNFLIEKISKISPIQIALDTPAKQSENSGVDDAAIKQGLPPLIPSQGLPRGLDDQINPKMRNFEGDPNGPMRRIRNGKDAPDMRRMQPPPYGQMPNQEMRKPPSAPIQRTPEPSMPPQNNRGMDEQQRRMMEEEMEQRRQDMYNQPPADYYPPPPYGNDYYDNGYDGGYDYDYENYYDHDYQGKKDTNQSDKKTATYDEHGEDYDPEDYHGDFDLEDEYLYEMFEE